MGKGAKKRSDDNPPLNEREIELEARIIALEYPLKQCFWQMILHRTAQSSMATMTLTWVIWRRERRNILASWSSRICGRLLSRASIRLGPITCRHSSATMLGESSESWL